MGKCDMRDSRRHVLSVVEQGHNASVETLHAASVVLQKHKTQCNCVMIKHLNTGSSLHEHLKTLLLVKKFPTDKEVKGLPLCSQNSVTGPNCEPAHSTLTSLFTSLRCIRILFFHLLLNLPNYFPIRLYMYLLFSHSQFHNLYVMTVDNTYDKNKFNVSSK